MAGAAGAPAVRRVAGARGVQAQWLLARFCFQWQLVLLLLLLENGHGADGEVGRQRQVLEKLRPVLGALHHAIINLLYDNNNRFELR